MKLNLALNIMMGSLITKSVVYGQEKALKTRSLTTMEEVVGAGCRNSIIFYGHTKTKDGSKCVKSTLCEASHTNDMFIPQARDTCVQFSDDEPECSLFEVVTSFEEGWSLQHLTMKPSKMDASLDPKSVKFLASEDKLVWKELFSSEVAFQNREDKIEYAFKNEETYYHYALQYEKSKETMHVGKVGLVESYTASCTANLFHKITGVSIPYYETMAPTSAPTKKPFQFDNKVDLVKAVNLWTSNINSAVSQYGMIDDWDVSLITDMYMLFNGKTSFNEDLSRWNVAAAINMNFMFTNTPQFNQVLCWKISSKAYTVNMFEGSSGSLDPDPNC